VYDGKKVSFTEPLEFSIEWEEECYATRFLKRKIGCWIMEFEDKENDIYVWSDGKTKEKAEEDMAWAFVILYEEYALERDEMLSKGARRLKTWLLANVEITEVKNG